MGIPGPLAGHTWTILPTVLHRFAPRGAPDSQPWAGSVEDAQAGRVALSGLLRHRSDADACLIVVHGLGGAAEAHYCVLAARAADQLGLSCLRLCLRGADQSGADFYHAGLTADLAAAIASPELQRYRKLYVLGYSLGGHVTLCYGLDGVRHDPRVAALAAVCAPLDLQRSCAALDRKRAWIYRYHVLAGLKQGYTQVARRRAVPTPLAQVLAARTIRMWDKLTVVPRFGFESVEHYYASMSVGPRLHALSIPSLLLQVEADPMIPPWTYEEHLQRPSAMLAVERLAVGGHVGFPGQVAIGGSVPAQVDEHIVQWLMQH